eukprot:scaffold529_cov196-Alexandrium_tamarense.AAC.50
MISDCLPHRMEAKAIAVGDSLSSVALVTQPFTDVVFTYATVKWAIGQHRPTHHSNLHHNPIVLRS